MVSITTVFVGLHLFLTMSKHESTGNFPSVPFTLEMKGPLVLLILLVVGGQRSLGCPNQCSCMGSRVNCSSRSLMSSLLPTRFPAGTTELLLHNNLLTTIPNELLDGLSSLHSVSLHDNPWICDCGILYLRAWLMRQPAYLGAHRNVYCSQPNNLKGRLVSYLTEEEVLDTCHYWYCDLAFTTQVCLLVFVIVQLPLLGALLVFLRRFERLSKEVWRTTRESLIAEGENFPLLTRVSENNADNSD